VLSVLEGREVEMYDLVPKVRQRQCIVLETNQINLFINQHK